MSPSGVKTYRKIDNIGSKIFLTTLASRLDVTVVDSLTMVN